MGRDCVVYENARIQAYGKGRIAIGGTSIIGDARIYSRASVVLGSRVVTGWNVFVQDFDPHPIEPELRALQMQRMCRGFKPSYRETGDLPALDWDFPVDPITIGDDVWLGANVSVLKGARIGDAAGCVVATGSVVTAGDYPARSVLAGGVPARVVKEPALEAGLHVRAVGDSALKRVLPANRYSAVLNLLLLPSILRSRGPARICAGAWAGCGAGPTVLIGGFRPSWVARGW